MNMIPENPDATSSADDIARATKMWEEARKEPGFEEVQKVMAKAGVEWQQGTQRTLPDFFYRYGSDAAFYVGLHVLGDCTDKMSQSTRDKVPVAKKMFEHFVQHSELGVNRAYCEKILEGIKKLEEGASARRQSGQDSNTD